MDQLLRHHGDVDAAPGLLDFAVNVRASRPPAWLRARLAAALDGLGAYPSAAQDAAARAAVAARHGRDPAEVLVLSGVAEGFALLPALAPRSAAVVHPSFTEPEVTLRRAGIPVRRVLTDIAFRLKPKRIPSEADLVVFGNPTNPTSVLHPAADVAALARPGRVLVVDEAFADTTYRSGVSGEPESLAARRDLPGLIVLRSLTKTWGLAGLRIGYALGPADLLARLATAQPLWAVSTPALAAATACASPVAVAAEREIAAALAVERDHLVAGLAGVPDVTVVSPAASAFVALRLPGAGRVRLELRRRGYAVRRGDTFPGLGADWLRIAVRDTATTDAFLATLTDVLKERQ